MCMFRQPFVASIESALIQRIVCSKHQPISANYSRELAFIVDLCLTKDPLQRPQAIELLMLPCTTTVSPTRIVALKRAVEFGIELPEEAQRPKRSVTEREVVGEKRVQLGGISVAAPCVETLRPGKGRPPLARSAIKSILKKTGAKSKEEEDKELKENDDCNNPTKVVVVRTPGQGTPKSKIPRIRSSLHTEGEHRSVHSQPQRKIRMFPTNPPTASESVPANAKDHSYMNLGREQFEKLASAKSSPKSRVNTSMGGTQRGMNRSGLLLPPKKRSILAGGPCALVNMREIVRSHAKALTTRALEQGRAMVVRPQSSAKRQAPTRLGELFPPVMYK